jgi:hypothetical protein
VRFNQNQREWHTWKDNRFDLPPEKRDEIEKAAPRAGVEPAYRR